MKRIAHTGTLLGVLASGLQVVELSYNSEGTGWEADHLILGGVPMVYNGVKFGVIESLPRCGKKPSMMVVTAQGASSVVMTQGWQSQSRRAGLTHKQKTLYHQRDSTTAMHHKYSDVAGEAIHMQCHHATTLPSMPSASVCDLMHKNPQLQP